MNTFYKFIKNPTDDIINKAGMIFLPVKHSFKFISWENPSDPPVFVVAPKKKTRIKFLPTKDSFKFISPENPSDFPVLDIVPKNIPKKISANNSGDKDKRTFLKVASVAGASIVASQLLPKKAEALIMGSSPTTGIVGVKNSSNVRVNPATEETVASLLKATDLTFDAGSLQVKVTSLPSAGSSSFSDSGDVAKSGLVDGDRHVQVDVLSSALPSSASTETTLQTISFGGFKFTLRMVTVGEVDYVGEAAIGTATSAASWRIKKIDNTSGVVITWAGTGVFNQVWDNYASLSYS